MIIKTFTVGMFLTNCYVVACDSTKEAIIVDPGFSGYSEADVTLKFIEENALRLLSVVNTHGHPDHTCGNRNVKGKFRVPILIHEYDAYMLGESGKEIAAFFGFENPSPEADKLLHDGDAVTFGSCTLKVMHTPGHSQGSISLFGREGVFTGDTLFEGSIGRTDFPESSEKDILISLKKLTCLPDRLVVYPGHGPRTTIGGEKKNNPFLGWRES